jgi:arylsulfatase A-like enzyme
MNSAHKPNVLFIAVDDMRDWTSFLGGYPGTVYTPNMERLIRRGVNFTNAHCPAPLCNPSRTAVMTGLRPSTTGVYDNGRWWRPNLPEVTTIPEAFIAAGYRVEGAGKIHHHTPGFNPPDCWHKVQEPVEDSRAWVFRSAAPNQHPEDLSLKYPKDQIPWPEGFPRNGITAVQEGSCSHPYSFDWGDIGKPDEETGDYQPVLFAQDFFSKIHQEPFFLGVGFTRPHLPWYAPARYLDLYPLESVEIPPLAENELAEVPPAGREIAAHRSEDWRLVQESGTHREAIRGYLASISFTDANVGRVLAALEGSAFAENTVIALWADHGFHLGEKDTWHKCSLWEPATRIPLIVAVPSAWHGEWSRGTACRRAVSSLDIYPTLLELCGIEQSGRQEGTSLVPLLENPEQENHPPALVTWKQGNHAVRSDRHRYIRYADGDEELYDHREDPLERVNLLLKGRRTAESDKVAAEHACWLPEIDAPPAPDKSAFDFDWKAYTWDRRDYDV